MKNGKLKEEIYISKNINKDKTVTKKLYDTIRSSVKGQFRKLYRYLDQQTRRVRETDSLSQTVFLFQMMFLFTN